MSQNPAQWDDLRPRVLSAAVMLMVGAVDLWLGGWPLLVLVALVIGAMIWELARLSAPDAPQQARALGVFAGLVLFFGETWHGPPVWLVLVPLIFAVTPRRLRLPVILAALAIMVAGKSLFDLRDQAGIAAILWLVGLVIISDVAGYFAGRLIGGPKFWPSISPKKTWSGTVAGWIGALVWGLGFYALGHGGLWLAVLSPAIALAGQMGDIGESWLKRRAGIKDSSRLIPGHGGVLDRFDAVIGASLAVIALQSVLWGG